MQRSHSFCCIGVGGRDFWLLPWWPLRIRRHLSPCPRAIPSSSHLSTWICISDPCQHGKGVGIWFGWPLQNIAKLPLPPPHHSLILLIPCWFRPPLPHAIPTLPPFNPCMGLCIPVGVWMSVSTQRKALAFSPVHHWLILLQSALEYFYGRQCSIGESFW